MGLLREGKTHITAKFHKTGLQYSFACKTDFFSFQNHSKNLDPSYKMDLDLWNCLRRVKLISQQNFIGLSLLYEVILERGKLSYSQRNTIKQHCLTQISNIIKDLDAGKGKSGQDSAAPDQAATKGAL